MKYATVEVENDLKYFEKNLDGLNFQLEFKHIWAYVPNKSLEWDW